MKTVFITGASTGIGYECAKVFLENGWNVVATMRNPQNASEYLKQKNLLITIIQRNIRESGKISD